MRAALRRLLGQEGTRFALVGLVNTGLDLGAYFLLQAGGTPVVIANLLSTSLGLSFSFVANRSFTFSSRSGDRARRQLLLFLLCTGVGLWIVQPVVILEMNGLLVGLGVLGGLQILAAKSIAIGIGMVWNWTLYNKVVFVKRRIATAPAHDLAPTTNPPTSRG